MASSLPASASPLSLSRPRQLNVDMRLVYSHDDEQPIRMPVTSKKRRLRYALMEEDDDDDEEEQQQTAGEEPFEESRKSSLFQKQDYQQQEEQFILPPQQRDDDSSSSSSSESDKDGRKEHTAQLHSYTTEDAAFVAPENRSTSTFQHSSSGNAEQQQDEEDDYSYWNQQQDDFPYYMNPPPSIRQQRQEEQHEVVDLCESDNDDANSRDDFVHSHRATFYGVRAPQKSPQFNANARQCFSSPRTARKPPPSEPNAIQDDIVECWSSDDEYLIKGNQKKPAARRVTDVQEPTSFCRTNDRQSSSMSAFASTRHKVFQQHSSNNNPDDDSDEVPFLPAPSRRQHRDNNVLNRFKTDRVDRRRRVRDASNRINTAASVMLRNHNRAPPAAADLEQATDFSHWSHQGQSTAAASRSSSSSTFTTSRNDIVGGSGVGPGNYSFVSGQSTLATSAKGNRKKTTRTKAAASGGGGKKKTKKWGGGKRKYYRKATTKGGNRGGSMSNRGRGRGRGRGRAAASNEEYSRQDPLLGGVGGANITF